MVVGDFAIELDTVVIELDLEDTLLQFVPQKWVKKLRLSNVNTSEAFV